MYQEKSQKKLFSMTEIGVATFLFSLVTGAILVGINWLRLGRQNNARVAFVFAALFLITVCGVMWYEIAYEIDLLPEKFFEAIPLLNIAAIFGFKFWQGDLIKAYKEEREGQKKIYVSVFYTVLIGLLVSAFFFGSLLVAADVSVKNFFKYVQIESSQEYTVFIEMMEADAKGIKKLEDLGLEEIIENSEPAYEKYGDNPEYGPGITIVYGMANLEVGNFEKGKAIMEKAVEDFKENDEVVEEFESFIENIEMWRDIDARNTYSEIYDQRFNLSEEEAKEALEDVEAFHEAVKEIESFEGDSYVTLSLLYSKLGMKTERRALLTEGAIKYPKNKELAERKLVADYVYYLDEHVNMSKEQKEEAIPVLEEYHERFKSKDGGESYHNLALFYWDVGRVEDAQALVVEGSEKFPEYSILIDDKKTMF